MMMQVGRSSPPRSVVTGSGDCTAKLWDTASGAASACRATLSSRRYCNLRAIIID
jgi:WD40 repeat protein